MVLTQVEFVELMTNKGFSMDENGNVNRLNLDKKKTFPLEAAGE